LGLDINSTIEEFMKMPKISEFSEEISKEWSKNETALELLIDLQLPYLTRNVLAETGFWEWLSD
jgi:hypothetical protein